MYISKICNTENNYLYLYCLKLLKDKNVEDIFDIPVNFSFQ